MSNLAYENENTCVCQAPPCPKKAHAISCVSTWWDWMFKETMAVSIVPYDTSTLEFVSRKEPGFFDIFLTSPSSEPFPASPKAIISSRREGDDPVPRRGHRRPRAHTRRRSSAAVVVVGCRRCTCLLRRPFSFISSTPKNNKQHHRPLFKSRRRRRRSYRASTTLATRRRAVLPRIGPTPA